jgi:long-subunit fatty acid transport protein
LKRLLFSFLITCFLCSVWATHALSQEAFIYDQTQINSSPNPIGSGARAQGMGGAFIAVADDATAASWNPGGLMQLEQPEFSFALSFEHRRKDFNSSPHPEASGINEIYREDLNYFSFAWPFRAFDKNMVLSLNYQRMYDFYDDIEFDQNLRSDTAYMEKHVHFKQTGSLKAFAPAFAIQITPRFSLGITFNFWTDELGYDNEWESERVVTTKGSSVYDKTVRKVIRKDVIKEKNYDFEGFNMNIGFLWHVNRVVTLGGVIKTPFTADFHRKTWTDVQGYGHSSTSTGLSWQKDTIRRQSMELKFPMSYGIGLAFRLSDEFTVACDIYRTKWSDFCAKGEYGSTSPITGMPKNQSDVHDTTQVRLGCEYLFVLEKTIVPLRFGVFYDPEPSEKHPDDYFGISVGTGIMIGDIVLDCAYVYRWGRDVKGDVLPIPNTKADVDQHKLFVSVIYHF